MWKIVVIYSLHLVFFGSPDLIDVPSNTVVGVGQKMEMNCHTGRNSIIRVWTFQKPLTLSAETIFVNWKDRTKINNAHFGIANNTIPNGVLVINSTQVDDAGIYDCTVQKVGGQPNRYSAHLIVFKTEPHCESSLSTSENILEEGTYIWMRCAINFRGGWTPIIEWRRLEDNNTNEERSDLTDLAISISHRNANFTSSLTIALNATSNSSYYLCKIYFSSEGRYETVTANNIPDYSYTWKSPMVKVVPPSVVSTEITTTDLAKSIDGLDLKTIYAVVLSFLIGAAVSSVVVVVIYKRGKKRQVEAGPEVETLNDTDPDEYQAIVYDEYEALDEVVMIPHCSDEKNPLEKAINYYALTPRKEEMNRIYTGINTSTILKSDVNSILIDDTYLLPVHGETAVVEKAQLK